MKKQVCVFLAILLLSLPLSACKDSADTDATTAPTSSSQDTSEQSSTESTAEFADREGMDDGIGKYDFGGDSFDIVLSTEQMNEPYFTDEENGSAINDAVYKRTANIEERFNVKLNHHDTGGNWNEVSEAVRKSVLSGDHAYDLAVAHTFIGLTGLMSTGALYDWNQLPAVDMTKPWWNHTVKEQLEIGGVLLTASSDYIYQRPMIIYFNKQMIKDYNLENPYELVKNGKWTWDKLSEMAKLVSKDLNGDGNFDENDQYGFSQTVGWQSVSVLHSQGMNLATFDTDGYPRYSSYTTEKMSDIFNKFYDLLYSGNQTLLVPYESWMGAKGGYTPVFGEGHLLFLYSNTELLPDFRDITLDFGILPLPKYDEAQVEYRVMSDTQVLIVPADIENPEMVGVISEALAAESYKYVVPAVYEVTYENKYLRDSESYEMFNIIRSGLVYEFSWTYGEGNGMTYALPNMMAAKNKDLTSFYEKNAPPVEKQLAKVIDEVKSHYAS
ncbi:MAG: hypothetical protein AB9835_02745 [Eubacteriales bacterium]